MTNYCWRCWEPFNNEEAEYCQECTTYICPHCGTCFCKLSSEAQKAVTAAMVTYGHWAFGQNPRKKPSGLAEDLYYAFLEKGLIKNQEEFMRRHQELYRSHPEIVEQVHRERGK